MIAYKPIPQPGGGIYALDIYRPGEWMRNKGYSVLLGGGGHGERKTLAAAKAFLLERAIMYCDRKIEEAKKSVEHYEAQKQLLVKKGLVRR